MIPVSVRWLHGHGVGCLLERVFCWSVIDLTGVIACMIVDNEVVQCNMGRVPSLVVVYELGRLISVFSDMQALMFQCRTEAV